MSKKSICSGICQNRHVSMVDITTSIGVRTGLDASIVVPAVSSVRVNMHSYSAHSNDCATTFTWFCSQPVGCHYLVRVWPFKDIFYFLLSDA